MSKRILTIFMFLAFYTVASTQTNELRNEHSAWKTFTIPWNDAAPSPMDVSSYLPTPAGGHGFIEIKNGHFYNSAGRWKAYGFNLVFSGPLPTKSDAPKLAKHLAKYGVNCLRIHHLDNPWPRGILQRRKPATNELDNPTRSLDAEAMDLFDYFFYQCKQNGIYFDLNLNVSRPFTLADGAIEANYFSFGAKNVTYFDPHLIQLQKEYARQLLTHVNPYTKTSYASEPGVALVEILNENSLVESWKLGNLQGKYTGKGRSSWTDISAYYGKQLDDRWNAWLKTKYTTQAALQQAWGADYKTAEDPFNSSTPRLVPDQFSSTGKQRFMDEASFYGDLELTFFTDMHQYLKNHLQVKQIVLGTADHHHGVYNALHVKNNATLGMVDAHNYWQYTKKDSAGLYNTNTSMIASPNHSVVPQLARTKVAGMPMMVSETNAPYPNEYRTEFIPIFTAYAMLQDWDGIFYYAYSGSQADIKSKALNNIFNMSNDPVAMAQFAASAIAFYRGDVQPAQQVLQQRLTNEQVLNGLRSSFSKTSPLYDQSIPGKYALINRVEITDFNASSNSVFNLPVDSAGPIVSDTKQLTWIANTTNGRVLINTPNYNALTGKAPVMEAGHLKVEMPEPFGAFQLISITNKPVETSEKLLLVVGAKTANAGMQWLNAEHSRLKTFGEGPVKIQPMQATVTLNKLNAFTKATVYPLNEKGQLRKPLQSIVNGPNGEVSFALDVNNPTVWYMVQVQR